MSGVIEIKTQNLEEGFSPLEQMEAISALEDGSVLFFPNLKFNLTEEEEIFLKPDFFSLDAKSIKYNPSSQKIWGAKGHEKNKDLTNLISRYSDFSVSLVNSLLPHYRDSIDIGNASLRPIEAQKRKQSKRQDDTRLHVDAFPSRPSAGKRLLRVFANVNNEGVSRIWNLGERFEEVAHKFLPKINSPVPFMANLLNLCGITKSLRTKYDHYMLYLHDLMKLDDGYQIGAKRHRVEFNPGSVWVCFSDKTSHAALSGRGLLEQTMLLEPSQMKDPSKSPLHILERILKQKLV